MPAIVPVGGQVRDVLLNVSGADDDPQMTITADTYGPVVYIGESRMMSARLIIAGTVSGTLPTLDVSLQSSADGVTAWATLAAFPQQTLSHAQAIGTQTAPAKVVCVTPVGRPYIRVFFDVGGTTPSFGLTEVLIGAVFDTAP